MNLIRDLTSCAPGAKIKFASEEEIEEEAIPELDPMHICMRSQFSHKLRQAVENLPPEILKLSIMPKKMTYGFMWIKKHHRMLSRQYQRILIKKI
jgi:hypothetical protein